MLECIRISVARSIYKLKEKRNEKRCRVIQSNDHFHPFPPSITFYQVILPSSFPSFMPHTQPLTSNCKLSTSNCTPLNLIHPPPPLFPPHPTFSISSSLPNLLNLTPPPTTIGIVGAVVVVDDLDVARVGRNEWSWNLLVHIFPRMNLQPIHSLVPSVS